MSSISQREVCYNERLMTPADLLEQLLCLRGLSDPVKRQAFLVPTYDMMYDPFLMHDMARAVDRIFLAIKNNERICIYSDYDADGIPGGVILHDFFKKINYSNFCNYIPHRHSEGYGVHKDALLKLSHESVTLIITVDVGITAVDEVSYGNSLGLEIIITDHHEPLEVLPDAFAICNPKLGTYPDRMLCGSGVVFKLVQAMIKATASNTTVLPAELTALNTGWEKWLLDLAGLATLSDMVPLINENRIIAYFGMKVLEKNQRPGLRALFEKSGITVRHLTETDIVFSITPKLNAAGRMAHPKDAFQLLAARDSREAGSAAEHLTLLNDQRKKIVATIMKEVHKKVLLRKVEKDLPNILVLGDPIWPAGILGLIASKITEAYHVTTFVWGAEGDSIKGSCRGVGDIEVVQLMQHATHLLTQFGGHADAGGFSTTREHVHFLEEEFNRAYDAIKYKISRQVIEIAFDSELNLSDVTMAHYRAIRQMAPFGMGNPKPVFAFKNITVHSVRQFGKTKEHLEIGLGTTRAISWYATATSFSHNIIEGETITLLAEFDHSVFRGKEELRLMIRDVLS